MKKALLASLFVLPISVSHGASLVYRNAVLANNPVVYYEFDEVGGATATDTVGSVNGTYVGAIGYGAASGAANLGSAVDDFFAGPGKDTNGVLAPLSGF